MVILTINEQSMIHYLSSGKVKVTTDMEEVLSEGEWGLNDLHVSACLKILNIKSYNILHSRI